MQKPHEKERKEKEADVDEEGENRRRELKQIAERHEQMVGKTRGGDTVLRYRFKPRTSTHTHTHATAITQLLISSDFDLNSGGVF